MNLLETTREGRHTEHNNQFISAKIVRHGAS